MLFSKHITIPVNRQKTNPYIERVKIAKGTVKKVEVIIPIPSAWCVGVSIWYSTSQKWPTSRTEWIPGGLTEVEFDEEMVIDDVPLYFEVRCYNEDLENEHMIWVAFNILRPVVTGRMQQLMGWLGQEG